jgi:NO-binding membrane sensor protein with MHYT domain
MHSMQITYDFWLVALSYAISVFGSFTALLLALRIPESRGWTRFGWTLGAATALGGCAIWAMHFIAMLAYKMSMPVRYDIGMTLLSMAVAIAVTGIGFSLIGGDRVNTGKLVLAGVIAGLGVAAMHYLGMAAMIMQADIRYDNVIVAVSVLIAIVAAIVALWLAFNLKRGWQRLVSAFVMGLAVCGMHYTGMAAATMVPNDKVLIFRSGMAAAQDLGFYIFLSSFSVLATLLLVVAQRRWSGGGELSDA